MTHTPMAQSGQPEGLVHIAREDERTAFNRLASLCGAVFSGVHTDRGTTCKPCRRLYAGGAR